MKNVVLSEIYKEGGKYKIRYYNLERKVAYALSFVRWKKIVPVPCKEIKQRFDPIYVAALITTEIKQRFDPIYVAALITTEIDYLKGKVNEYSVIVNSPNVTINDKTEYTRIIKVLHYLNNYTL